MKTVHIDWKDLFPPRPRRGCAGWDGGDDDLFADQDRARGLDGFYVEDAAECASRRVDLRQPTDRDPGPLEMDEAPDGVAAVRLRFPR